MMSSKPLQIEGIVEALHNDGSQEYRRDLQRLEDENRSLRRANEDLTEEKERLARTIKNLQTTLNPIYRGLRALFGEIELAVGEEMPTPSSMPNGGQHVVSDPRWQNYKNQFPGVPAKIIDALLIHAAMSVTNLAGLLRCDRRTIYAAEAKLRKAGATTLNGGLFSLKR